MKDIKFNWKTGILSFEGMTLHTRDRPIRRGDFAEDGYIELIPATGEVLNFHPPGSVQVEPKEDD